VAEMRLKDARLRSKMFNNAEAANDRSEKAGEKLSDI